jgi:glycerate kinase
MIWSATNDSDAGMLEALGMRLLKANGSPVDPAGAQGLVDLASLYASRLHPGLREADITVACAVKNPLTGPNGTSQIFWPRKGATNLLIPLMDGAWTASTPWRGSSPAGTFPPVRASAPLAALARHPCSSRVPSSKRRPGASLPQEIPREGQSGDLIITGEGKTDFESL